jgi:hypothetical protein
VRLLPFDARARNGVGAEHPRCHSHRRVAPLFIVSSGVPALWPACLFWFVYSLSGAQWPRFSKVVGESALRATGERTRERLQGKRDARESSRFSCATDAARTPSHTSHPRAHQRKTLIRLSPPVPKARAKTRDCLSLDANCAASPLRRQVRFSPSRVPPGPRLRCDPRRLELLPQVARRAPIDRERAGRRVQRRRPREARCRIRA